MDEGGGRVEFPGADPVREYSDEEKRRLTINLYALLAQIENGVHADASVAPALIHRFHRRIFDGVRRFAGRARAPGYGARHVTFGPHRSIEREEVPAAIKAICDQVRRSMASLRDNPSDPDYERSTFHIAVWAQAEVIRVHPFEDGNGRASRALTDHILVSAGFDPVPIEVCRQEYIGVLNAYFLKRAPIDTLVDLYLRLATGG